VQWFYYSDTNTSAGSVGTVLVKRQHTLTVIHKVENMNHYLLKNDQMVLFIRANTVYNVYDLCQELSVLYPHVYFIIIVPDNMENIKRAMHVGASDILRTSSEEDEIKEVILQAENYLKHRASKENIYPINLENKDCRVISVSNPKGGTGKTSLVVNAAAAFAKQGKSVAVMDANLQFGDIALYFDIKPNKTIYEWVKEAYGRSHYSVDQYMVKHNCGVSILAAPPRPEFFEFITMEHVKAAIEEMKKQFDIVLIDIPGYLSDIHFGSLKSSEEILLLTTNDIPTLRTTKLYLDTLESINLKGKVKLIINRENKNSSLNLKKIEEILGVEVLSFIPDQENIVKASLNEGIPYVISQSNTPIAKAVMKLTTKLLIQDSDIILPRKKDKNGFLIKSR
jgi:pilus assembly protein CpaE